MRARRVLAGALMAGLLATSAPAIPIFDDPYTIYLLRIVANILTAVQQVELAVQAVIQRRIDAVISGYALPASVLRDIGRTIDQVKSIRDEVEAISCEWRFSPRTSLLRNLYLR